MAEPCSNVRVFLLSTQLLGFGWSESRRGRGLLSFLGKGTVDLS